MSDATVLEAADKLAALIHRVAADKERVIMTGESGEMAALVPVEDLTLLEDLEDQQDIEDAQAALEAYQQSPAPPLTLDDVLAKYGLTRTDLGE